MPTQRLPIRLFSVFLVFAFFLFFLARGQLHENDCPKDDNTAYNLHRRFGFLQEERAANAKMLEELQALKAQLGEKVAVTASAEPSDQTDEKED